MSQTMRSRDYKNEYYAIEPSNNYGATWEMEIKLDCLVDDSQKLENVISQCTSILLGKSKVRIKFLPSSVSPNKIFMHYSESIFYALKFPVSHIITNLLFAIWLDMNLAFCIVASFVLLTLSCRLLGFLITILNSKTCMNHESQSQVSPTHTDTLQFRIHTHIILCCWQMQMGTRTNVCFTLLDSDDQMSFNILWILDFLQSGIKMVS